MDLYCFNFLLLKPKSFPCIVIGAVVFIGLCQMGMQILHIRYAISLGLGHIVARDQGVSVLFISSHLWKS